MADILLHTLLFPPDGNSNAYIFGDIALELQKHGHNVTVITTTPHYSILKENLDKQPFIDGAKNWYKKSSFHGMECYHIIVPDEKGGIRKRLMTYINFHYRALRLSKNKNIKADVVITQSPPLSIGIINALIGKKKKAKSVYIVQDLFPDGPITQGKIKNKFIINILRLIEKSVYKHNDAIIAISEGIKGHLEKRVPVQKTLRTIPNFVDTDIYHTLPKDNPMSKKFDVSGKFVISYVGNIGNAHDLSPILYCANKLKGLNIEFVIAGSGIKKDYYEIKAREENLDNIKFIGYQKREDTPMINAFSDICLVMLAPHIKGYSFPSKIYTLMGMAKPIIVMCSAECNAADFITETKSGWAVESGNCEAFTSLVEELYNNPVLLNQFGNNSLKVIEAGYTKESVGRQYDDLIKDLCTKGAYEKRN
jgi:colanic acid biosynthesis glycosyl transferase WcaI